MKQDARSRRQPGGARRRGARDAREGPSAAFVQAFVGEKQLAASLDEDAEDEAWVAQMMEWITAPRANPSSDVVRRVIARVECLA